MHDWIRLTFSIQALIKSRWLICFMENVFDWLKFYILMDIFEPEFFGNFKLFQFYKIVTSFFITISYKHAFCYDSSCAGISFYCVCKTSQYFLLFDSSSPHSPTFFHYFIKQTSLTLSHQLTNWLAVCIFHSTYVCLSINLTVCVSVFISLQSYFIFGSAVLLLMYSFQF